MVQVVQAMLHIRLKRRDAEAGHAPPGLTGLTVSWGTPGAHVVAEKGARGTRAGRGVSHSSLEGENEGPIFSRYLNIYLGTRQRVVAQYIIIP